MDCSIMKVGINNVVNSEHFDRVVDCSVVRVGMNNVGTGVMEGLRQASTMAPSWTKQIARRVQNLIFQWF